MAFIYDIKGEQKPNTVRLLGGGCVVMGGCAQFSIVFSDHKSFIPESIIRGVQ